ncbi:protein of unknown function [Methanoculleus bourgensis]|uniref:Uncharacterized protein n=1 Tax=Methanoculleus bourgensis TaxID=83986 RepID=A0A0X3BM98_9EURY|nr:protein of unknown function [Methanoculleus bourgensis]
MIMRHMLTGMIISRPCTGTCRPARAELDHMDSHERARLEREALRRGTSPKKLAGVYRGSPFWPGGPYERA